MHSFSRPIKMRMGFLLFSVMLLLILSGYGQGRSRIPKYTVGMGEYQCFIINNITGKLYGIGSNTRLLATGDNNGEPGLPIAVAIPSHLTIKAVASGLH